MVHWLASYASGARSQAQNYIYPHLNRHWLAQSLWLQEAAAMILLLLEWKAATCLALSEEAAMFLLLE